MTEEFKKVAKRDEIKSNELKLIDLNENQIVLTELAGQVIAFDNLCTHEDCYLV